jgi:hypothetical protein
MSPTDISSIPLTSPIKFIEKDGIAMITSDLDGVVRTWDLSTA